jgi:hypothetical protein
VVFPGLALLLFVLGWNLAGDAFRDALDPKMRGYRVGWGRVTGSEPAEA